MFIDAVRKLPIEYEFIGIKSLKATNGMIYEPWEYISNVLEPFDRSNLFSPDYYIIGSFHYQPYFMGPSFRIDPLGKHILYITGMPKSNKFANSIRLKFRIQGSLWAYYWEDDKYGYLTQVISK